MILQRLFTPRAFRYLAASAALAASSLAFADDDVETYDLDGVRSVEFSISRASITVLGSDRDDLQLTLEKPLVGFDPEAVEQIVERKGDTLVIRIEVEDSKSSWWSFSDKKKGYSKAELLLPSEIAIYAKTTGGNVSAESLHVETDLHTSGGNVTASDIKGPLTIRTSGGNIRLAKIMGDTDAHTSGGNISVDEITGKADVHTSGGRITIKGAVSALSARTSGGNITATLNAEVVEPLELSTSGGSIEATLPYGLSAPASLSTSGGSVTFRVPESQSFELLAKTNGGHVNLAHPGSFSGELTKKKIDGKINGEGPKVRLSTSGGGIRVESL